MLVPGPPVRATAELSGRMSGPMARWQPDNASATTPDAAIARTRGVHETERRRRGIR